MPETYGIAVKSHLLGRLRLQDAPHLQPVRDTEITVPEPRGERCAVLIPQPDVAVQGS